MRRRPSGRLMMRKRSGGVVRERGMDRMLRQMVVRLKEDRSVR